MTRKTIKSLEAELVIDRETLRCKDIHNSALRDQIESLRAQVELHKTNQARAERDAQWHRQLAQNLSEAICAHMRNR